MNRQGYELPEKFYHHDNVVIFEGTKKSISSTQIRDMVKNQDNRYKELVPEEIASYIENKRLYL